MNNSIQWPPSLQFKRKGGLISRNPVQRFKEDRKIIKAQGGTTSYTFGNNVAQSFTNSAMQSVKDLTQPIEQTTAKAAKKKQRCNSPATQTLEQRSI